jgi:formylglycine-generating enzyme required for sulfatase activity
MMSGKSGAALAGWASLVAAALVLCAAAQAGRNRAILVGINDYGGSRLDYCVADAKALAEQLVRGGEFQAEDVIVMTDDAAENLNRPTSANITDRLENLAQLGETGTLFVFFAGHGVVGEDGGGYLLTLEGTVKRSIKIEDLKRWMGDCRAKDRILVLDCCHAGKGMRDLAILPTAKAAAVGLLVMASCGEKQGAFDDAARGHGAFTASLLDGLNGAADADKDQRVTADELFRYAERSVKAWVYNRFNKVQTPVMMPADGGKSVALGRPPKVALPPPNIPRPVPVAAPPPVTTPTFPLPPSAKTFEEWVKRYADAQAVLEKAKSNYMPMSAALLSAERNVAATKDGLRTALLAEGIPNLTALRDQYKTMRREMRPSHPDMKALAARIGIQERRVLEIAGVCLSEEELDVMQIKPSLLTVDCGGVSMKFALIPKGEFTMGSAKGEEDEKPAHLVTIETPFYIGIHEVTQAQYEAVMGQNPSGFRGRDLPVEKVSWQDAVEFCRRLTTKTGKRARLPTEAEWEYACRAESDTAYSLGDDASTLNEYAWDRRTSDGKTHPVGQKKPNDWGLYDMHGNVWEWCQSLYRPYPYREDDGREDLTTSGKRVLRGGSWSGVVADERCAKREARATYVWFDPVPRIDFTAGFRVVVASQE